MNEQDRRLLEDIVPRDFDVKLLGGDETGYLYAASRPHVIAIVCAQIHSEKNRSNVSISQNHVARFLVAEAIAQAERARDAGSTDEDRERSASRLCRSIGLSCRGDGGFDFELLKTKSGIPEALYRDDVKAYKKSSAKVSLQDGLFILPGSKSFSGKQVASKSKRLIEAVAFERESLGELDAGKWFGIYSAFCTWKDFCEGQVRTREFYEEHIDGQFHYDADDHDYGDFMELALRVQDSLLSKRIWGKGISVPRDEAVDILQSGMQSLSSIQFAQFSLMNGMHASGLFLSLAQVLGLNDWDSYIEWKTAGFAPDSEDEQCLRSQVAIIKTLGELGGGIE